MRGKDALWGYFYKGAKQNTTHSRAHCLGCIEKAQPKNIVIDVDDNILNSSTEDWFKEALVVMEKEGGSVLGIKASMIGHLLKCPNGISTNNDDEAGTDTDTEGDGVKEPAKKKRKLLTNVKKIFTQTELKVFSGINIPFNANQKAAVQAQFARATISANLPFRWVNDPEVTKLFLMFRMTADDKVTGIHLAAKGKTYLVKITKTNDQGKDGESMCDAFIEMIDDAESETGCIIILLCSDNDGGGKKGRNLVPRVRPWILVCPCTGHQFNLILRDYFKKSADAAEIAEQATAVIGWIQNHTKVRVIFDNVQIAQTGAALAFIVARDLNKSNTSQTRDSEHPQAMARGQSVGHEDGVVVVVMVRGGGGEGVIVVVVVIDGSIRRLITLRPPPPPHRIASSSSSWCHRSNPVVVVVVVVWEVVQNSRSRSSCRVPCCRCRDSSRDGSRRLSIEPRPETHPSGCLTIVRAAGATIVAPRVVMVVIGAEKAPSARRKIQKSAEEHCNILESSEFWKGLQTVIEDIEPICYGTNINQSDSVPLNDVLLTFAGIWQHFHEHSDRWLSAAMKKRIEKHWKELDQPLFMFALILNLFEGLTRFGDSAKVSPFTLSTEFLEFYRRVKSRPASNIANADDDAAAAASRLVKEAEVSAAFLAYLSSTGPFRDWRHHEETFKQLHGPDPILVWEQFRVDEKMAELADFAIMLLELLHHNRLGLPKLEKMSKVGADIRRTQRNVELLEQRKQRENHGANTESLLPVHKHPDIFTALDDVNDSDSDTEQRPVLVRSRKDWCREMKRWIEEEQALSDDAGGDKDDDEPMQGPGGEGSRAWKHKSWLPAILETLFGGNTACRVDMDITRIRRQQAFTDEERRMELLQAEVSDEAPDDGALEGSATTIDLGTSAHLSAFALIRPGQECLVFKCAPGCTRYSHPGVKCLPVPGRVSARVDTRVRVFGFGREYLCPNTLKRPHMSPKNDDIIISRDLALRAETRKAAPRKRGSRTPVTVLTLDFESASAYSKEETPPVTLNSVLEERGRWIWAATSSAGDVASWYISFCCTGKPSNEAPHMLSHPPILPFLTSTSPTPSASCTAAAPLAIAGGCKRGMSWV
ncbi:hypothetical protein BDZ89DRAFT_1047717 [Hymenopellis radicata]|nr:hypothetical protein BDZ89DRAFT_1047717 [Hymenopellis radicata]